MTLEEERDRWKAIVVKKARLMERNLLALDYVEVNDPELLDQALEFADDRLKRAEENT